MKKTGPQSLLFVRLLRRRSVALLAALYLLAAIAAAGLPLFGTLGYESALLFGVLAAWLGAILPFSALKRLRRLDGIAAGRPSAIAGRWLHLTIAGWLLLVPPMAVLTANAVRVPNCAMFEGVLYWLLIPFMTAAFSSAVLLFLDALLGRRARWAYFLLLCLLLVQPFVQILTRPQIFAYNHVFGMFLGLSWDQSQPPFATLALYRLSTLAYVALLLAVAAALHARRTHVRPPHMRPPHVRRADASRLDATGEHDALRQRGTSRRIQRGTSRRMLMMAFAMPLAAVLLFHVFSDRLGFTNSYAHLRAELGAECREGNIRLVYDPATVDHDEARRIAEEHLFQLERVCAELGVKWEKEIVSYLYPDGASKRRLLGTESSDLARPWRGEIHVSLDSWSETVKHELVHVVAGSFGPWLTRAPFVRVLGLTEGLAMAVEWSWGSRTLHESAAAMLAQGLLPHARDCIGTAGFVTGNSSRGYVASGSLTRWLMDSLGVGAIRRAYAADDLERAVQMDYDEIDRRWREFLSGVPRLLPDSLATAYAFRRPSLFSAVCPRVITERNRDAAAAMRAGRPRRALALYRDAERLAPNARSAFGIVGTLYELRRWDSVIVETDRFLSDTNRAFSLLPMLLWKGAASWRRGDSATADRAFADLLRERLPGWTHGVTERLQRVLRRNSRDTLALVMTDLLLRNTPARDSLRRDRLAALLSRDPRDPVVTGEYMRAFAADSSARDAGRRQALRAYREIEHEPLPYDLRMLAVRLYYREGKTAEAQRLLRHQLNEALTVVQRDAVTEWMARCAWQLRREGREKPER